MNVKEIKHAVDNGLIVHWANEGYKVIKDKLNQYLIVCDNGSCIGLTWLNGVTLNGEEKEFFLGEGPYKTRNKARFKRK